MEKGTLLPAPAPAPTSRPKPWYTTWRAVVIAALVLTQLAPALRSCCTRSWTSDKSGVDWKPCAEDKSFQCGYLAVPKDYFDASAGEAHIAMLRVPATAPKDEQLGTIVSPSWFCEE
ncbi:hypothetical protein MNV49_004028 [Pseudohyphozyma bogoriensis]|nr:hypothetical protein MNV49_004028 [Pseudohyphozyma bogoriensis]